MFICPKTVFRCDAEVVISNLFKVFDTENTGNVVPTELLIAFSMSMNGTGRGYIRCNSDFVLSKMS